MDFSFCCLCFVLLCASVLQTASSRPLDDYIIDQEIGKLHDSSRMEMLEKLLLQLIPSEGGENGGSAEDIEDDSRLQQLYNNRVKDLHVSTRSSRPSAPFRFSHVVGGDSFDGSSIPLRIAGTKRNFDRNGWGGGYGRK